MNEQVKLGNQQVAWSNWVTFWCAYNEYAEEMRIKETQEEITEDLFAS